MFIIERDRALSHSPVRIWNALADPERDKGSAYTPPPPGKSQVTVGFLRKSGTDAPRESNGVILSNCISREVHYAMKNSTPVLCKIN